MRKGSKMTDEQKEALSVLWKKKYADGYKSPNIGLTRTDAQKKTLSDAHIGQISYWKGKTLPAETCKRMSDGKKELYAGTPENHPMFGKHHRQEVIDGMSGENSPHWRGGVSFGEYPPIFNESLKTSVRKRDSNKCMECGIDGDSAVFKNGNKYKLHVHHIDFDKNNCNMNNLITLCTSCHGKTQQHIDFWISHYNKIIEARYGTI